MDLGAGDQKLARAARLNQFSTRREKASPSPPERITGPSGVSTRRAAPAPPTASSRTLRPSQDTTAPGSSGEPATLAANRSAIQSDFVRAKATTSVNRRSDGATATASPARASMRIDNRRARGFTDRRSAPPPSSGSR